MVDTNLDKYTIIIEEQDNYTIELNEQGPQGLRGPQGEVGPVGPQGEAATISIGTVTTGEEGSDVSVVNRGTSSNAVLDFEIPRGDKGDTGPQGISVTGVEEISKIGLVSTYRMYFSNDTHFDYQVTDGSVDGITREQVISLIGYEPASYTSVEGLTTRVSTLEERVEDLTASRANVSLNNLDDVGKARFNSKQDVLISATNIKTINGESILGSGNIEIKGGGSGLEVMYDKDNKAIKFIDSTNVVTFTINPDPSDATVVITSGTCNQVGNSITVSKNSLVEYTVSKDGMDTKSGYLNVVEDTNIDIKLSSLPINLTINNTTDNTTTLVYNDSNEENKTSSLEANKNITINVVPNTIIKATDSYGTYFIITNTSGSIDYTPWAAGGAGGGAWAYCCNSIKTVNSTDSISLTYNDTLTGGSNTITGTGSASNTSDDYGISTPISITTTSSTNTYIFNYNPSPTETYSFGGVFALIDTNGVGSVINSSSSGRLPGSGGGGDDF